MKRAVIGNLKRFWSRFKEENPTVQVSAGIVSVNIPLREKGKIRSTRSKIDDQDFSTPFVQSDPKLLVDFYSNYRNSKEFKFSHSPYAETIPLRSDERGFSYGVNVKELSIVALDIRYKYPEFLERHAQAAHDLFKKINNIRKNVANGDILNDQSVRIAKFDLNEKKIHIQPATYLDQVATNLTLDWASGLLGDDERLTIRNDFEEHDNNSLAPFNASILANTLGVAAILINPESEEVLVPIRGSQQAIMDSGQGKFHCSASGVFKWDKESTLQENLTFDFFMEGMKVEIEEELGLTSDQYELIPVAFSRELVRGGKPQLFFVAETNIDISSVRESMKSAIESWEFLSKDQLPVNSPLAKFIDSPLSAPQEMFTYEGWMALKIAIAYLYKTEPPFRTC